MSSVCTPDWRGFPAHHEHYIGIKLTGDLNGWATTKDLILYLAGKLTVKVRSPQLQLNSILPSPREELAASLNTSVLVSSVNHVPVSRRFRLRRIHVLIPCVSGLATIANMGAEVGATTSTFPYTPNMRAYLHATGRAPVAHAADQAAANGFLAADEGVEYDEVIEIVIFHFPRSHSMVDGLPRISPK